MKGRGLPGGSIADAVWPAHRETKVGLETFSIRDLESGVGVMDKIGLRWL